MDIRNCQWHMDGSGSIVVPSKGVKLELDGAVHCGMVKEFASGVACAFGGAGFDYVQNISSEIETGNGKEVGCFSSYNCQNDAESLTLGELLRRHGVSFGLDVKVCSAMVQASDIASNITGIGNVLDALCRRVLMNALVLNPACGFLDTLSFKYMRDTGEYVIEQYDSTGRELLVLEDWDEDRFDDVCRAWDSCVAAVGMVGGSPLRGNKIHFDTFVSTYSNPLYPESLISKMKDALLRRMGMLEGVAYEWTDKG